MKLLVIGQSGQMAQAFNDLGDPNIVCVGRPDIDLTDPGSIDRVMDHAAPDIMLNAAAYTAVDAAEQAIEMAYAVNEAGPRCLAERCAAQDIPFIHISTDCVFDGTLERPYEPSDDVLPLGVYGASKLAGEVAVQAAWEKSLIVRVSWIFSRFGENFVRTMIRLAQSREEVSVVRDQIGCPTEASGMVRGLVQMARQAVQPGFSDWGIYHLAGQGEIDRASFAESIFAASGRAGGPVAKVVPILTVDYPTPAQRPLNARLGSQTTQEVFGVCLPEWRSELDACVAALIEEEVQK